MSDITNLPVFPHTIGNLDDKPNLPADEMKAAFERDCIAVWEKVREVVPDLNAKFPKANIVKIINSSSTDSDAPTAKAVYDAISDALLGVGGTIAETIITDWLNDHPEATTTVQDGAVTYAKLHSTMQGKITRVDDMFNALSMSDGDNISMVSGNYTTDTDPIDPTMNTSVSWKCAKISCSPGDKFTIKGTGGNGPRLWCFTDSSYNLIGKPATRYLSAYNLVIVAPTSAAYLFVNTNDLDGYVIKGVTSAASDYFAENMVKNAQDNGCVDLLLFQNLQARTEDDVTFTPKGGSKFHVQGTASDNAAYGLINQQISDYPVHLENGKGYYVKFSATNVGLEIVNYTASTTLYALSTDRYIEIPATSDSYGARLTVANGTTVNEDVSVEILSSYTNRQLEELAPRDHVPFMRRVSTTDASVTWTWNAAKTQIAVSGTPEDTGSTCYLMQKGDSVPGVVAGASLFIDHTDPDVHVNVRAFDSSDNVIYTEDANRPCFVSLPADTSAVSIRMVVSSGTTVSKTIDAPKIYVNTPLSDVTSMLSNISTRLSVGRSAPTDAECKNAFVAKMNEYVASLGMTDTTIASASGYDSTSYMSVKDMAKLALVASGMPDVMDICCLESLTLHVKGQHARNATINNSYLTAAKGQLSQDDNYALGGKAGSLQYSESDKTRNQLTFADISGHLVAICLMGKGSTSYSNIYYTLRDVAKAMKEVLAGTTPTITSNMDAIVSADGGYLAFAVPTNGNAYGRQFPQSAISTRFPAVADGVNAINRPCSVLKMVTTIIALQYIVDKSAYITIKESDITAGSGSGYYVGDRVNVIEALQTMISESSNTLATAVARYVGSIILTGTY